MNNKSDKKILFVMRNTDYFHYYRTIICALLRRGYHLRLLFDRKWSDESSFAGFTEFQKEFPFFSYGWAISRTDHWRNILFHTREILSYRNYLLIRKYHQSRYYEERWLGYLAPGFQRLFGIPGMKLFLKSRIASGILRIVEWVAPAYSDIVKNIKEFSPDAVIASPVNMRFSSVDLEYLKIAVKMHIPTALPVFSWDNLTTKGLIHIFPDRLLVWNDVQQWEAQIYHHIPKNRIRLIGAPMFDVWFCALKPSLTRTQFCEKYGLRVADPIVVYFGSSSHIAKDETWLIEELRHVLDMSDDARLQKTQIIVRPHPANYRIYGRLKNTHDIVIIPEHGTLPDSDISLKLFYDTLYHCVAVIDGINTSAIIDSLVAGKPGIAIITDAYARTQREAAHFNELMDAQCLYTANGTAEVPAFIKKILDGNDSLQEKRHAFIQRYVRPRGLHRQAGEWAADEIESLMKKS